MVTQYSKQLIVALCILGLYMIADTCLTAVGLDLGLREVNPTVNVNKLIQHTALFFSLLVFTIAIIYRVAGWIDKEFIARYTTLCICLSYVYVLFNNLYLIWEVTSGHGARN